MMRGKFFQVQSICSALRGSA